MAADYCSVCGAPPPLVRGRCRKTCYPYWKRTGRDRSEDLVIKDNVRKFDREMETEAGPALIVSPHSVWVRRVDERADQAYRERRERRAPGAG